MMSVWYCCPSKRPPEQAGPVLARWRERGYKIALVVDDKKDADAKDPWTNAVIASPEGYRGYAVSVNALLTFLIERDQSAEWFVCGADDVEPDPNHTAEEIAQECSEYFAGSGPADRFDESTVRMSIEQFQLSRTFGVMQPTGDSWGDAQGPYIDRVAGSPWIGREFARRMYGGSGPYWPEYFHMGVDEELQAVAIKVGVFWQRPDLTHYHAHWGRPRPGERMGQFDRMPAFLAEANSPEHWRRYKALFAARQAAGFPGHEPIA